jgi:type IV secretory pathway protease TraF
MSLNAMRTKILLLLLVAWLIPAWSFAITIPAGTMLLVRTNQTVSSSDPVGKTFSAQLANDVVVAGKVVLRKGTKAVGRIDSNRRFAPMSLVLNVTQIAGKKGFVPIKTVTGFQTDGLSFQTRRGVSVGRGGFVSISTGTLLRFQLAQSVNL